jgi:hypothetical protein
MKETYYKIMTFIYKISYKRKPNSYPRSNYYETLLDKYSDGKFYSVLINKLKVFNEIKTAAVIQYLDNKILSDTVINDIIRKNGKPNYKIVYDDLLKIKVLFYRQKMGKHKTKLEFHFLKNSLFFYTYTFTYLNFEDKNEIIQILKEKYFVNKSQDIIDNYIVDKNNNSIILDDGIVFSIYYICGNRIAWGKILEYIDLNKVKDVNKHKSYRKILYKKL